MKKPPVTKKKLPISLKEKVTIRASGPSEMIIRREPNNRLRVIYKRQTRVVEIEGIVEDVRAVMDSIDWSDLTLLS